jgi:hypothetical protein
MPPRICTGRGYIESDRWIGDVSLPARPASRAAPATWRLAARGPRAVRRRRRRPLSLLHAAMRPIEPVLLPPRAHASGRRGCRAMHACVSSQPGYFGASRSWHVLRTYSNYTSRLRHACCRAPESLKLHPHTYAPSNHDNVTSKAPS